MLMEKYFLKSVRTGPDILQASAWPYIPYIS